MDKYKSMVKEAALTLFVVAALVSWVNPEAKKSMLIKKYDVYEQFKQDANRLFLKGWEVQEMQDFGNPRSNTYDLIVVYKK